jgi:hypothetical protein
VRSSGAKIKIPKSFRSTAFLSESIVTSPTRKTPWDQTVTSASVTRFSWTAFARSRASLDEPTNTRGLISEADSFILLGPGNSVFDGLSGLIEQRGEPLLHCSDREARDRE